MAAIGLIAKDRSYGEDDLLPISALQHLMFCERQCALIHVEKLWVENRFTAEGRLMHERAHEVGGESRGDVRIVRGLRLRSLRLGLSGVADVVEFHRAAEGIALPGRSGVWQAFPVEYKRGRPKKDACDTVQLCAQAVCLEEMLGCRIPAGALFYGKIRRRKDVGFDAALRATLEATASRLHALIRRGRTPAAVYAPKCDSCSLQDQCLPEVHRSACTYLSRAIAANGEQA